MIVAIYARKSTEQNLPDEEKSIARQTDHGRAYAERKGWTVADEHVYADDGISGAEFVKRPGLLRLMNALKPRPPFQALVMSEESRLGREQIETAYLLKQITEAGVRVFFYLEDRERTLETAMDKVMLSLTNFASEMEREKARQRTHDAMIRKARAHYVAGGKVYGYDNVEVLAAEAGADGHHKRLHVVRVVNRDQAAVVRRLFELYASGLGIVRIAKQLNEERVPSPRRGWAPTGIREMLYRPLYRGLIVWNQSQRIDRGGTKAKRRRPEAEWIQLEAPELRIIPDELWRVVNARLETNQRAYARGASGHLMGRPSRVDIESKYLLGSLATCAVCGGSIIGTTRPGRGGKKHYYRCAANWKRGAAICGNATSVSTDVLDSAVLHAIAEVLDERIFEAAVARALAQLRAGAARHLDRRTAIERELSLVEAQERRLVDGIKRGEALDPLLAALKSEEQRKKVLVAQLEQLQGAEALATLDEKRLQRELRGRLGDAKGLLARHTPQARQMLRKLLTGRLTLAPVEQEGQRGVRFTGIGSFARLLPGEALPLSVVPPG